MGDDDTQRMCKQKPLRMNYMSVRACADVKTGFTHDLEMALYSYISNMLSTDTGMTVHC